MVTQRLLVLDDDEAIGKLLVFVAQGAGFEAQLCQSPERFFEALVDWRPSHIAVDLTMPEMSGREVIRLLAADRCPAWIIISSGAGNDESEAVLQEARELGLHMMGVLAKPFSLKSLRALLAVPAD